MTELQSGPSPHCIRPYPANCSITVKQVTSHWHTAELESAAATATSRHVFYSSALLSFFLFSNTNFPFTRLCSTQLPWKMLCWVFATWFHFTEQKAAFIWLCVQFWLYQTSLPIPSSFTVSLPSHKRPSHEYFENKLWGISLSESQVWWLTPTILTQKRKRQVNPLLNSKLAWST